MRLGHHEAASFRDISKGRFHDALKHRTTMLKIQGVACEADEQCRMLKAFATSPDMAVTARREATIPYAISDGHLFVPITINGRSAQYTIDTGAAYSGMTEAEALRLGLTLIDVPGGAGIGDASGIGMRFTKVAVAGQLQIGGVQLTNVSFLLAERDDLRIWNRLPEEWRGAIGIQVLFAIRRVRWNSQGTIDIAAPAQRTQAAAARMHLHGTDISVDGRFNGRKIEFYLDTGSSWSKLDTRFAQAFPDAMKAAGEQTTQHSSGDGGTVEIPIRRLPELTLSIGSFQTTYHPMVYRVSDKPWKYYGTIGLDGFSKAQSVTLDFQKMKLTAE